MIDDLMDGGFIRDKALNGAIFRNEMEMEGTSARSSIPRGDEAGPST